MIIKMNITLRNITSENLEQVVNLKVKKEQVHVASNLVSITQSKEDPDDIIAAIYCDDEPVGFVMYSFEYESKCLWISRFMIDSKYQRKGYGMAALNLLKQIAMDDPHIVKLGLSTHLENVEGIEFYSKFGFRDTGTNDGEEDPEEIFEFDLKKLGGF